MGVTSAHLQPSLRARFVHSCKIAFLLARNLVLCASTSLQNLRQPALECFTRRNHQPFPTRVSSLTTLMDLLQDPELEPISRNCLNFGLSSIHAVTCNLVTDFTLTQQLSLGQQCEAGIRFFDLRLSILRRAGQRNVLLLSHTYPCVRLADALEGIRGKCEGLSQC